ncbi:MAG TPA: FAD-dependent oxidoreductase [Phycisphaerales bacterium]|nr:FAD-dependent oxidoreductase [Phycisphaerales bacterium]
MNPLAFEVLVIGGGHAGVEAAWAAANLLPGAATVGLVTIDPTKIGVMSCNPAIGGLAKGQLVREIDALGGLMALATDAAGIQFKMLNTSKGPAVHGPRAQCDKHAYAEAVQLLIASRPEVTIISGTVERLLVENGRCVGAVIASPAQGELTIRARALVLTTGTFMKGLMHTGQTQTPGGRAGEAAAHRISDSLRDLGYELGRLKTGTPPRLKRDSITWQSLGEQLPDESPVPFSDLTQATSTAPIDRDSCAAWWSRSYETTGESLAQSRLHTWRDAGFIQRTFPLLPQVSCRTTQTSAASHDTIRANVHRAPMYNGQIESAGPRYCPSIEDKVMRFADRDSHGVFLEPESLRSDWVYCNGISSSLPADVQDVIVRSMPGCEHAEIHRYGYAVEYDMVRPHQIHVTGHTKLVEGLFLAGQINGTSGYEEAAAQGLIAGANAARFARNESEFILGRDEAYIGVLMDDLVTKTPVEPYRMFTSRAEHRLLLRADNAPERLTQRAITTGLLAHTTLGKTRAAMFTTRAAQVKALHALVDATTLEGQPLEKLLRGQAFELDQFKLALPHATFDESVWRTVHAERRYAAYIVRQQAEVKRHAELEHKRLPGDVNYLAIQHLRPEARQALHRFRPDTFGQAARLEGITPADITLLSVLLGKR